MAKKKKWGTISPSTAVRGETTLEACRDRRESEELKCRKKLGRRKGSEDPREVSWSGWGRGGQH